VAVDQKLSADSCIYCLICADGRCHAWSRRSSDQTIQREALTDTLCLGYSSQS